MSQRQRPDARSRRDGYPLAAGLIASALIHLFVALLNPGMDETRNGHAAGSAQGPRAQFTVLSLGDAAGETRVMLEELPPEQDLRRTIAPRAFGVPSDPGGLPGTAGAPTVESAAERLRYRESRLSAPTPMREGEGRRAVREAQERVRRAGEELGPLPPRGVTPSRGGGAGIRIPFGFAPPPPPITVAAPPLPDSIVRRDSARAAARAAAYRDSILAARDSTRLRNVAPRRPLVLPPVPPPDTTGK